MPAQLQKRGKGGHKGFGAPSAPLGKGKGSLMTRPHSDGFLQDMMTPMGLHNMSDVQQYRKLVEMRYATTLVHHTGWFIFFRVSSTGH